MPKYESVPIRELNAQIKELIREKSTWTTREENIASMRIEWRYAHLFHDLLCRLPLCQKDRTEYDNSHIARYYKMAKAVEKKLNDAEILLTPEVVEYFLINTQAVIEALIENEQYSDS